MFFLFIKLWYFFSKLYSFTVYTNSDEAILACILKRFYIFALSASYNRR